MKIANLARDQFGEQIAPRIAGQPADSQAENTVPSELIAKLADTENISSTRIFQP